MRIPRAGALCILSTERRTTEEDRRRSGGLLALPRSTWDLGPATAKYSSPDSVASGCCHQQHASSTCVIDAHHNCTHSRCTTHTALGSSSLTLCGWTLKCANSKQQAPHLCSQCTPLAWAPRGPPHCHAGTSLS
eukprot:scaffold237486_cov17-Tisochrysis_lutea.AAC.1